MATNGIKNGALLLGKAVKLSRIGTNRTPCVQIRCRENEYNDYIKMYFAKPIDFWALDKSGDVSVGDSVLIQPVKEAERIAATVTHEVNRVITKYGIQIDPVTKKRIVQRRFWDRQELRRQMVKDSEDRAIKKA
ncbi:hypothetical protein M3Y97_00887100 [Aphelenchoides bicaudatus]|nr:hypothetical protein M3Y97_00887100 [Aphelenchoides bicaudatus]